ncbi:MAG: hypothetical protein RBT11_18635 [Desulfobacterales bacterium]|jgi:hypothetical protein|nr:hypothetical protein [Desulfobacterales bacterium]
MRTKEAVTEAIKTAVKNCPLDREDIAAELSRLVGEEFSVHALNNALSDEKQNRRFPLEFVKALTLITGDLNIIRAALQPEYDAIDINGKAAYEYGVMLLEDKARSKKKRQLEQTAAEHFTRGKL